MQESPLMTVWNELDREIEDFTTRIRALPVLHPASPQSVRGEIESSFDLVSPIPLADLTRRVATLLRSCAVHVTHPRYFGLFNPSVSEAGIVGDTLAALYNPQLATWSHAPAANELERLTLRYLTRALGFEPDTTFANLRPADSKQTCPLCSPPLRTVFRHLRTTARRHSWRRSR